MPQPSSIAFQAEGLARSRFHVVNRPTSDYTCLGFSRTVAPSLPEATTADFPTRSIGASADAAFPGAALHCFRNHSEELSPSGFQMAHKGRVLC